MTLLEWRISKGFINPLTGLKEIRQPFNELPNDAKYILHTINGDIYGIGSSRQSLEKNVAECSSLKISTRKQYIENYENHN